jgi:hypothetical protein
MRDSFPQGLPGAGSQGDPGLDALLTEEVADLLLDGWPRHAALSTDLRQLRETVDALRAAPSRSELRAESLALAAFRSICGASLDDTIVDGTVFNGSAVDGSAVDGTAVDGTVAGGAGRSDGMAHTLRLEIPRDPARRGQQRARHRARPDGRPSGLPRPRRPRALGAAAALALVVIIGAFAYAGSLPGPIQNAAHVAFGAPPVKTASASPPSVEATGAARATLPPATGARQVRPSASSAPPPSSSAAPAGPKQWCQAYFANPWRPGSTSWDKSDFEKLSKAAPGGARWVLWYCSRYLNVRKDSGGKSFFFPSNYPGGSWAWSPDPGQDAPPGSGSGTGSAPGTGTMPGPADGPGSDSVSGHDGSQQDS